MCTLCDEIYPEKDINDIRNGVGKYKNVAQGGSFIKPDYFLVIDNDMEIDIVADYHWDSSVFSIVPDITYCPDCGRKLKGE